MRPYSEGEAMSEQDWRERRGRFAGLDPDTDDRPQVMPVEEPEVERQVHVMRSPEEIARLAEELADWRADEHDGA